MVAQLTIGLVLLGVKNAFCGTDPTFVTEQRNLAIEKHSISFNCAGKIIEIGHWWVRFSFRKISFRFSPVVNGFGPLVHW